MIVTGLVCRWAEDRRLLGSMLITARRSISGRSGTRRKCRLRGRARLLSRLVDNSILWHTLPSLVRLARASPWRIPWDPNRELPRSVV